MGRSADSLERPRLPLEPKSRPPRRENSEFSHRGFGKTGPWAGLSLRNNASWNGGTRDLPFRTDRDDIEHAPVAILVAPAARAISSAPICSVVRFPNRDTEDYCPLGFPRRLHLEVSQRKTAI